MKFALPFILVLFTCLSSIAFNAWGQIPNEKLKRFVLVGDSTVTDNSGWGIGFAELMTDVAVCTNMAKGGRSSRSFRDEGWWQKCLDLKPNYLLIQFGHNDQPGKGPERESEHGGAFRDHLKRYVALLKQLPELSDCFSAEKIKAAAVPQQYDAKLIKGNLQVEETDTTITIHSHAKLVLAYNKQSPPVPQGMDPRYHRSGFLHPVNSPSGQTVTATFPVDHAHQHGIFTAWVQTTWNERNIDFWNLAKGTGRVLHQRVVSTFEDGENIGFEVDMIHRAEEAPVVDILRERWKVTAIATDGTYHAFDIKSTQHAQTDLPLIVQEYHYGGTAVRGPTAWLTPEKEPNSVQLSKGCSFLNNLGSDRFKGNHEPAKWVCMTGTSNDKPASIAVLSHPSNFRAPQPVRIHPTKPYFVFTPCFDGEFKIDREHPYSSLFRFIVTDSAPNRNWLDEQWNAWAAMTVEQR